MLQTCYFWFNVQPFLLNGTIKEHLQKYLPLREYQEVVLQLLEYLFVNDSSSSFSGIGQCLNFQEKSKTCLADANFHLRKRATNNSLVQNVIDHKENKLEGTPSSNTQHDDETYIQNSFSSSSKYHKVLGINWETRKDYFVFEFANIAEVAKRLQVTKCNILKISAMFFDPLGVVCSIVLNAKILFQETCKQKLLWEAVVPVDINNKWKVFINELFKLNQIETKHHVLCCGKQEIEVHGFRDALTLAYGAVVVMIIEFVNMGSKFFCGLLKVVLFLQKYIRC